MPKNPSNSLSNKEKEKEKKRKESQRKKEKRERESLNNPSIIPQSLNRPFFLSSSFVFFIHFFLHKIKQSKEKK
jgi:hypothetical protein